ncbi:MAG: TonB-dependent receptor [Nitrosomonas sp.]|nr:TonB-dependent receptor [Nitrosomonas sp.]TXI42285.1 MAG: TonB-dependent receptor [Nitrosomonas sp.]
MLNPAKPFHPKLFIVLALCWLANTASAESKSISGKQPVSNPFLDLSIEELMKVEVTSASRHSQKLSEVPSAIFVITQDDIRRSGATSIPEALRMAPGVEVARIGTDKWAVSIRGFNGRFADKLQVMMDGRSVYNPLFAGVQWEQQDTLMEDIERIEVIRGPNAAVWGANAVNGVINIITKKAADTQGTLISGGGGSFEHGFAGARYGAKINEDTPFRIYVKGFTRNNMQSLTGENTNDQWHSARGGFRLDHRRGIDQFTVQGDIFYNSYGDRLDKSVLGPPIIPTEAARGHDAGGNLRLRWDRTLSEKSAIMLQTYYDRVDYNLLASAIFKTESFDIDFQHRFPLFDRHDVTWGANYRLYHNTVSDTQLISLSPRTQTNHMASAFIRDEITLLPERLRLNLGSRFDHNDFTGMEIQPNARLMWTPDNQNSIWMAVSRAVRTPSRAENDVQLNTRTLNGVPGLSALLPFPVLAQLMGSSSFNSEKLIAYEMGYRHQFTPKASIDISGFYNDYSQLRSPTSGLPYFHAGFPPYLILPIELTNKASGEAYGVETSVEWKPTEKWRLQGNYSFLNLKIHSDSALRQLDPTTGSANKVSPHHQISLRSNYDFSEKLQLNLWLRYVSSVDFYRIPGYVTMDAKLVHRPVKNVELFVVGQNLFSQNHREFVGDFIPSLPVTIPRGVYAGAEWRF